MNRGIQDRRDSGLKGYGKEWIQEKTKGQKVCETSFVFREKMLLVLRNCVFRETGFNMPVSYVSYFAKQNI